MKANYSVFGLAVVLVQAMAWATVQDTRAEPSPRGLAMSCFSCHGPAGKSPDAIPGINGKSAAYIDASMKAFRNGTRKSTVMQRIAKGYSDSEIRALAGYLAGLK